MTKILFPFILGIICYHFFGLEFSFGILGLIFTAMFILQLAFYRQYLLHSKSLFYPLCLSFFFVLGLVFSKLQNPHLNNSHYSRFINHHAVYSILKINGFCELKKNSWRCEAEVLAVCNSDKMQSTTGKVFLYLPKSMNVLPQVNEYYSAFLNFYPPPKENLPGTFSFAHYAFNKNILYLARLKNKYNWQLLRIDKNPITRFSSFLRQFCIAQLNRSITNYNALGIITAMLIGADDQIDESVLRNYSATGTIHILSVSGMHTGIIYAVLAFLMSFIWKDKKWLMLKNCFIIVGLWIFVLVSGSSPPAVRAALMLSLILVASGTNSNADTINVLLFSAFICLLYDVKLIFDLGFQLSYCAVLGIVFFHQPFKWLVNFNHEILNKTWVLLCTSFSAQILTLPIVLFYFHQFPNYFLVSNLLVVPLSGLVMYGGITLCLCASFHFLQAPIAWLCTQLVKLLNALVNGLANLPFAATENIHINAAQAVVLSLTILLFGLAFLSRKRLYVYWSFAALLGFFVLGSIYKWKLYHVEQCIIAKNKDELKILSVFNGSLNDWSCKNFADTNQTALNSIPEYQGFTKNNDFFNKGLLFLRINNKNILWFRKCQVNCLKNWPIEFDYVIIDRVSYFPKNLLKDFKNKTIITHEVSRPLQAFIFKNVQMNGGKFVDLDAAGYFQIEFD